MSRSGTYVRNLSGNLAYQSFRPSPLPPEPPILIDDEIATRLKQAYMQLGELNRITHMIPNRALFVSMYVRKEALMSSQIEGTQATLEDIFDPRIDTNVNLDVEEVINYVRAHRQAVTLYEHLPISIRFIKELHRTLMEGRRGGDKHPGELRITQNWIGRPGSTLSTARFVPPNPTDMQEALARLETYIHDDSPVDPLVKIALIHYQFETIHPFLDGNGRVGRLLISLLMKEYGILKEDVLYLSYYLKLNQNEYYDQLNMVRDKGDYERWIAFFLDGVIATSVHAIESVEKMMDLKNRVVTEISNLDKRKRATCEAVIAHLESKPIADIVAISKAIEKSFNAVANAIKTLIELKFVEELTSGLRYRVFCYRPYIDIFKGGTELR